MTIPAVIYSPEAQTYIDTVRNVELIRVTAALGDAGLSRFPDSEVVAHAAARGTAVHLACELFDLGTLDRSTVDIEIESYLWAWEEFVSDFKVSVWNEIETIVSDTVRGYAGRIDRVGEVNGIKTLVDIKTGAPTPAHPIQLAAYNNPRRPWLPRMCVYLKPNATYSVATYQIEDQPRDFSVFQAALIVSKWLKEKGIRNGNSRNY